MKSKIPGRYKELRDRLVETLESGIAGEAENLKGCSVGSAGDGGSAYLFVRAGLLRDAGDQGSMFSPDYCYEPTQEGIEMYKRIKNTEPFAGKENKRDRNENMQERTAVYAGSFDPPTLGHQWMIEQGTRLFDKLIVTVGINPNKKYTFSLEERLEMLKEMTKSIGNVEVDSFQNEFLVNYAERKNAAYNLRGVRNSVDRDYEKTMSEFNKEINPNVVTKILTPPHKIAKISSTAVRNMVGLDGWQDVVRKYVPEAVYRKLIEKYGEVGGGNR